MAVMMRDGHPVVQESWVELVRDGRVGLVAKAGERKSVVQFGVSGPFEGCWHSELRRATPFQIAVKTGRAHHEDHA